MHSTLSVGPFCFSNQSRKETLKLVSPRPSTFWSSQHCRRSYVSDITCWTRPGLQVTLGPKCTLFSKRSAHENHPNFLRSLGHRPRPRVILILSIGLDITLGQGQWPRVTGRTGQNQCALLLEKSVSFLEIDTPLSHSCAHLYTESCVQWADMWRRGGKGGQKLIIYVLRNNIMCTAQNRDTEH